MAKRKRRTPPNPLPCGCRAQGTVSMDVLGEPPTYRNIHVVHCPLHAAADELLAACKVAQHALGVAQDDAINSGGANCAEAMSFDEPLKIIKDAITKSQEKGK